MRLLKFLFTLFLFPVICCLLPSPVRAQIPPNYTPCNETADPEFHSLRPYQASPCSSEVAPYASFCGNNLTLKDTVYATYPGSGVCKPEGGKIVCKFSVSVNKPVIIDLSGADLPIMGNTEKVTNYKGEADQLTDAQKVNEYVSWYLNGVIGRAEYPFLAKDNVADTAKLINYSGPINKLLPQETQQQLRALTIKNAAITQHNQIIGCTYRINIFGHEIGGIPGPCYEKGLASWFTQAHRLSEWKNHLPPVRSDYKDFADYQKKYREWRGESCFEIKVPDFIPIIGGVTLLLCGENPLNPNFYSNLYPYIPLSSTEDRKGGVIIDNVSSATQTTLGIAVTNVSFSNQKPADLFFSHMQETDDLASILQDTFVSTDSAQYKTGNPTGVNPANCDTVDVRSNKGDDLFAGEIVGDLKYNAAFSCEFNPPPCKVCSGPLCISTNTPNCSPSQNECENNINCQTPTPNLTADQTCKKDIYISLSTKSDTPNIENIWSRLVAGPSSVFKRIFPKLGTYIGTIKDIPASTAIDYSGGGVNESTDLKLPHIGGISEYFLKGIQTMLRPKGYGESISFGKTTETPPCGDIPDLPTGSGACKLTSTTINGVTLPPTMVSILEATAQSYNVPPGLILGVMFGEGAFNPGRYGWTEDNVKKWSMGCASMPNCSPTSFPSTGIVPFFEAYWNQIKDAVKVVDPNRVPNPCNLLDAIFALAKDLSHGQYGASAFAGKTCYGITLNAGAGGSSSCSWDSSDYETAIRVWEFGTAYNSTYTCATKPGSCATGGGSAAACPGGDLCEKVGGSGNTSHNACVWDVAHSH